MSGGSRRGFEWVCREAQFRGEHVRFFPRIGCEELESCWRRLGGVTWLSRTLVLHINGSVLLEHLHTVWTKIASFATFLQAFPLVDLKHLARSNQSLSILKGLCAEETESNQNQHDIWLS